LEFDEMTANIPVPNRDRKLFYKLIIPAIGGLDQKRLDKSGQLYLRVLCRLTDKAFEEYMIAKESMDAEIKCGNKLDYGFSIINHLENCINAVNRTTKTFEHAETKGIFQLMSNNLQNKVKAASVSGVRNKMEHIEQYIRNNFNGTIFLTLDANYQNISVYNQTLAILDLVKIIETYHEAVSEILSAL
jgi:hypothetical protein